MHGIGIGVRHEDRDANHPSHRPEYDKGGRKAKLAKQFGGGADIPELGMQITREGHSQLLCTPFPAPIYSGEEE